MSKYKHRKHKHGEVIAVDQNYLPLQEMSRRKAMTALSTGRAVVLDVKTWTKLTLFDVAGRPFKVIVYPKAKAIPEVRLGFGRNNRKILDRDDYVCQYVGCSRRATTVDHVIPLCQGGRTTWQNLVGCCMTCNQLKGGRTPEQAGMVLKRAVRSPKFHLMERFAALTAS